MVLVICGSAFATGETEVESGGPANLTIWTFDQFFQQFYEMRQEAFTAAYPDYSYDVEIFEYSALYDKLNTVMLSGGQGAPDLIDVESGQFGAYTRGEIPFEPLNDYAQGGLSGRIAEARLALYSVGDNVYGLEHQLVPVTIAYRQDLFEQAGIEADAIVTWEDFLEAGIQLKEETGSYILGFNNTAGGVNGQVGVLVRGAGRPLVDESGNPDIDNPVWIAVVESIRAWVKDYEIAAEYENWQDFWAAPSADEMAGVVVADWTANALKSFAPDKTGLFRMMPFPLLNDDSYRLSVWGGTGLTMTKYARNKEAAWAALEFLMLDPESSLIEYQEFGSTPPISDALDLPELRQPDPYFGGQVVTDIYREYLDDLAVQRPAWWISLYDQAFSDHFFDFWEGDIGAAEFASLVQESTEDYIADEQ
jgi:ABC-type glycerol-3-phosphate transport system substrate-binding protein